MRLLITAALALVSGTASFGSVILMGPAPEGGAGLGNRNTVLTLQSPGNSTLETGCVGPGEATAGCGFENSDVKTGAAQIGSYTVAELGLASLADLRVIFNAAEPGNSTGVTLNDLVVTLYNTSTNESADFSLAAPVFLDATFLGVGQEGYLFGLDGDQSAEADSFFAGNGNIVVGLGASLGCTGAQCTGGVTGGPDSFALASMSSPGDPPEVPEPSTYMLMLSGAAMIAGMKTFRAKA